MLFVVEERFVAGIIETPSNDQVGISLLPGKLVSAMTAGNCPGRKFEAAMAKGADYVHWVAAIAVMKFIV